MWKKPKVCPICQKKYDEPSAISRKDNKTEICSKCGIEEAMLDFELFRNMEDCSKCGIEEAMLNFELFRNIEEGQKDEG